MKEIIINVEGMMCGGCEKRVQNALKNIEGVREVIANHEENIVKVVVNENVSENIVKSKIEDIGFKVV